MKTKTVTVLSAILALSGVGVAYGAPTVIEQVISWPDDGWYQVQSASTYKQMCAGGRSCTVEPGTYIVINHSTGERFNNIKVSGNSGGGEPVVSDIKVVGQTISWPNDGWYQVQNEETNASVCQGGRYCVAPIGTYRVINLTTGKRWNNIAVVSESNWSVLEPETVVIPAGTFTMGCVPDRDFSWECDANEFPAHQVSIKSFALGKTEVTFEEWAECVDAGSCHAYSPSDQGWGKGDRPVINVNRGDAQAYVAWLSKVTGKSYRLPSESEWEYASRGGSNTAAYSWGNYFPFNGANCDDSYCGDSFPYSAPVASFSASPYGLFDMHGNVLEWVEDCYHDSYVGAPVNGEAWKDSATCAGTVRGGSFSYYGHDIRSAARVEIGNTARNVFGGFRVALDIK